MKKIIGKSDMETSKEKKVFTVKIFYKNEVRIFSKEDERDAIPITEIFKGDEELYKEIEEYNSQFEDPLIDYYDISDKELALINKEIKGW